MHYPYMYARTDRTYVKYIRFRYRWVQQSPLRNRGRAARFRAFRHCHSGRRFLSLRRHSRTPQAKPFPTRRNCARELPFRRLYTHRRTVHIHTAYSRPRCRQVQQSPPRIRGRAARFRAFQHCHSGRRFLPLRRRFRTPRTQPFPTRRNCARALPFRRLYIHRRTKYIRTAYIRFPCRWEELFLIHTREKREATARLCFRRNPCSSAHPLPLPGR